MKKSHISIRMTLLLIVGVLNLIIAALLGDKIYKSWADYQKVKTLKFGAGGINELYSVSEKLSLSRANTLSLAYSPVGSGGAASLRQELLKNRKNVDSELNATLAKIEKNRTQEKVSADEIKSQYTQLIEYRALIDSALRVPVAQRNFMLVNEYYEVSTSLINEIQAFILSYSRSYPGMDEAIGRHMTFEHFVWDLAEYSGEEYALIGQLIAGGIPPSPKVRAKLLSLRGHIEYGWEILQKLSINGGVDEKLQPTMDEAKTQYFFTFDQIGNIFFDAVSANAVISYPISSEMWLGMAAEAVDSLLVLQDAILAEAQHQVDQIEAGAKREIFISAAIFGCTIALSLYCWYIIIFRVGYPINAMVNALYSATRDNIFEMPKIRFHQDEIGKLTRVLEVFQQNALKIKQSNEELERFAYIAAHDLKSPLRAVDNISQWLEEDLDHLLPQKSKAHLLELRRRVRLMDKLLDDTLEYARVSAKMEVGSSELVSGKQMVEEILTLLNPPSSFTVLTSDKLAEMIVNKFPLQQILYNLVSNAINHHDKGGGVINLYVDEMDSDYVFSVGDDGHGIAPEHHQKIFEMFQTLLPRDKGKGRGMGLAMVRKIVIAGGGKISVDSELGKGAIFSFTWPKSKLNVAGQRYVDIGG